MMNINSFNNTITRAKANQLGKVHRRAVVTGSAISDNAPKLDLDSDRRKRKDRRQKNIKPLIDLRSGEDRRAAGKRYSVDIEV